MGEKNICRAGIDWIRKKEEDGRRVFKSNLGKKIQPLN
jgi:hypothetical protein